MRMQLLLEADEHLTRRLAFALLTTLAIWLAASVFWVNLELDDGYSTIGNSQYFLGISDGYIWQRGPLMAWLLVPAEWLANALDLTAFAVWPHHASMAIIHLLYLTGVWLMLRRHYGARIPVLLGFTAAVPNVLFASYAPFISHDLFPGLILLLMLKLADDFVDRPTSVRWLGLVTLGLAALLIKQTYALFWVAVGLACAISLQFGAQRGRPSIKPLALLAAGSMASFALAWLVYSWVLIGSFGEQPFLLGPWLQYQGILANVERGGDLAQTFPPTLYLRNLSAFGYLAMTLALPGAFLCLRSGNRLQRSIAIAWIVLVLIMQHLQFKEVRYLGFLAPLTAFLVVAAIDAIVSFRRAYLALIVLICAVDVALVGREALRIAQPYYRSEVADFLGLFPPREELKGPVVVGVPMSFIAPDRHAFQADRFHRITHVVIDHLAYLHGYDRSLLLPINDESLIDAPTLGPGAIVIFSNDILTRRPPFRADNRPPGLERFIQNFTIAEQLTLIRSGDDYLLQQAESRPVMLLRAAGVEMKPLVVHDRIAAAEVDRLRGITGAPAQITLLGFRIQAYCDMHGCQVLH
jgi:hypothetical protein